MSTSFQQDQHDTMSTTTHPSEQPPRLADEDRALPRTCPAWCSGFHAQEYAEGATMWEASQHRRGFQDHYLAELRNPIDHRVWREGGGHYSLDLEQDPNPWENRGNNGDPLVRVIVTESHDEGHDQRHAQIRLTTGEARVLAAKLVAAADRADLDQ